MIKRAQRRFGQTNGRLSRAKIEEMRQQADAALERSANEPTTEKDRQDQATLQALDATKH